MTGMFVLTCRFRRFAKIEYGRGAGGQSVVEYLAVRSMLINMRLDNPSVISRSHN